MNATGRFKSFLKLAFPRSVKVYHEARRRFREPALKIVFSEIYRKNLWQDPESVSGRGSTLARTKVIRNQLPSLLQELQAKTLLDAACGDFNWMRHTDLSMIKYIGVDVVPDLIRSNQQRYEDREVAGRRSFLLLDITKERLPRADAVLCRDCLIHLSYDRIHAAIANFKITGAKHLLCTTHTSVAENVDCPDGSWRSLNLQLEPFNFPKPLKLIVEDAELGKCLGVWQLSDL